MNQLKVVIQNHKQSAEGIDAYLLCAQIYTQLKNLEKAIQAYSEAIAIDPQ